MVQIQEELLAKGNQRLGQTLHAIGQLNVQMSPCSSLTIEPVHNAQLQLLRAPPGYLGTET